MTQCWSEGALRAYLDRELPSEEMQRVAAHLGECTVCDCLCTELAARAAHVSALMELLPEWSASIPRPATRREIRPMWRRNWIGIAAAVAACLALAVYLLPERNPRKAVVVPAPVAAPPPVMAAVEAMASAPVEMPVETPVLARQPRRIRPRAPEPNYFVALDDEPFESGVIMRVDVKPGNVQADIVFGPDGRAHAFRLVSASQRNF